MPNTNIVNDGVKQLERPSTKAESVLTKHQELRNRLTELSVKLSGMYALIEQSCFSAGADAGPQLQNLLYQQRVLENITEFVRVAELVLKRCN